MALSTPEPETLTELLGALRVSVASLAHKAQLSRQTVYAVIQGRVDVKMSTLDAIADALRIPWERVALAFRESRRAKVEA